LYTIANYPFNSWLISLLFSNLWQTDGSRKIQQSCPLTTSYSITSRLLMKWRQYL